MNAGWGLWPRISWNPPDFTLKSGRFHLWNPPKIIKASVSAKTLQFDECRVGDFTLEIWWISPRFHLWNPPKIIKASVSAKTLQFDECRVGAMTKDFMKSARFHVKSAGFHVKSAWNPPDFKIMSFCVMIKYRSFVFRKTSDERKKEIWAAHLAHAGWNMHGMHTFHSTYLVISLSSRQICDISSLTRGAYCFHNWKILILYINHTIECHQQNNFFHLKKAHITY